MTGKLYIIPKVKQSGGTQGTYRAGHVKKRCNRILKDYLVQSASHIGQYGPEELKKNHQRRNTNGQHATLVLPGVT